MENQDNLLLNYEYVLPEDLIAQMPLNDRAMSKLIVLDRQNKTIEHKHFRDAADLLEPGDCLVLNTTKVIPARLFGKKSTGGKVELLFLEPSVSGRRHKVLLKPSLLPGQIIYFEDSCECTVKNKDLNGNNIVEFNKDTISGLLNKYGVMPLPPYIKRKENNTREIIDFDKERYQTVYADEKGAIAAPTAGLHFTNDILNRLKNKGVIIANIVLHVGWGTFKPIKSGNIEEHKMLPEKFYLDNSNAGKINKTLSGDKKIIAVGTTTVRTLETIANLTGLFENNKIKEIKACSGETDIFIYPSYKFKIVGSMFTNLHLPHSTPLMMASAFAGRKFILSAYEQAIQKRYRFFSYGDSMFIK